MPPSYPIVAFLGKHGGWLAVLVGLLPVLAGLCAVASGWPWPALLAGVVAGGLVWLLARSYVEILRIVKDTLVPR